MVIQKISLICFKLLIYKLQISFTIFITTTRINCKNPAKVYLTLVNYRLFSKDKAKFVTIFALKTLFPNFLHQMFHKFQGGLCNKSYHRKCVRDPALRSGEYIGISPFTNLENIVLSAIIC